MKFHQETELNGTPFAVALSSEITTHDDLFKVSGSGELRESSGINGIRLSGTGPWIVNPAFIQSTATVEIFGDTSERPISLCISLHPQGEDSIEGTAKELTFPSMSLMKAAEVCVEKDIDRIPNQITSLAEDDAKAVWKFLDQISDFVSYKDYLSIIEQLSGINPAFRFELSHQVVDQVRQMVAGWESNAEFRIESYEDLQARIKDFEKLSSLQKLPGSIEIDQILEDAIKEVTASGTLKDIVGLCLALDLPQHHPGLINHRQAHAIMAQSLLEEDLNTAWTVANEILDLDSPAEDRSFEQLANEAIEEQIPSKPNRWAKAVMVASGDYQTCLAISNYLYWTAQKNNFDTNLKAWLYKAASEGFQVTGITHMTQYAKYNYHAQLGYRYRQRNDHEEAADQFLQAYIVASNAKGEFDHRQLKPCITAAHNWGSACGDYHRFKGRYTLGEQVLETAIRSIELLSADSETTVERRTTRLRAEQRVLEMERQLTHAEYEVALETAGNIIALYAQLDDEQVLDWAITTRREIQAIVHEINGELGRATELHREIGEEGKITDGRKQWHIHRSDICAAKELALEGEYEEARHQLLNIKERASRLESEANDLAVVLDSVLAYQHGQQTGFQESVQQLSNPDDMTPRIPPMRVEYNYEEPLAVIHSAQWLQGYNVDEELLSMAVEVALEASLIPLNSGEVAASVGIDEVELRDQWMNQLPAPVAQRIKQIELDMTLPQTDYVGLGSRLFSLLELYFAILGEYYGTRKWGEDWRTEMSEAGKTESMTLGDLANVFDRCEEFFDSSETAFRLVNGTSQTPSVIKLRNDIGHIKTDDVDSSQFERFYERVINIFQTTVDNVPVIGRKVETRGEGEFQRDYVRLQWWRSLRFTYIDTEAKLNDDELYYFPPTPILDAYDRSSVTVPPDDIVTVKTDRVANKF